MKRLFLGVFSKKMATNFGIPKIVCTFGVNLRMTVVMQNSKICFYGIA